jgi:tRNA-2-methylthio-N6-dimethylallyladenosine synthase
LAERRFADDVPEDVKAKRLTEIIELQLKNSKLSNEKQVGEIVKVLVEGTSKRSEDQLCGRNGQNAMVIFPRENYEKGQYVLVKITSCTSATLMGEAISIC